MTTPTEIESLLERVRSATGPDSELDVDIEVLTADRSISFGHRPSNVPGKVTCRYQNGRSGTYLAPRFTASIDAAVALIKRMLPGWWWWKVTQDGYVELKHPSLSRYDVHLGGAATPPLAIIAAGLTALLYTSMETTNG